MWRLNDCNDDDNYDKMNVSATGDEDEHHCRGDWRNKTPPEQLIWVTEAPLFSQIQRQTQTKTKVRKMIMMIIGGTETLVTQ